MKLYQIISLLFALAIVGCSPTIETIEVKDDDGNIVEKYERRIEDNKRHGLFQMFDENGKIVEMAIYKNDTLDGKRTMFFENGNPQYVENYVNGKFEDEYSSFYENGQVKLTGKYTNGAMNGEWKGYHENGQVKELVLFVENEENGPFVEYHPNGKIAAEGYYLNGDNEHGELKLYDENGELNKKMNCDKGICRTSWKRDTTETK